jgi:hypothetical protein
MLPLYVHSPCFCRLRTKLEKICARKIRTPTFSSRFPARHAGKYYVPYLFRMACLWKSLPFCVIQLCCYAFVSMLIRIQIQMQGANPVRIRIRIRILFRLCHHIRLDFDIKNRVYFMYRYVKCQKSSLCEYKSYFERLEIRFMC